MHRLSNQIQVVQPANIHSRVRRGIRRDAVPRIGLDHFDTSVASVPL